MDILFVRPVDDDVVPTMPAFLDFLLGWLLPVSYRYRLVPGSFSHEMFAALHKLGRRPYLALAYSVTGRRRVGMYIAEAPSSSTAHGPAGPCHHTVLAYEQVLDDFSSRPGQYMSDVARLDVALKFLEVNGVCPKVFRQFVAEFLEIADDGDGAADDRDDYYGGDGNGRH